MSRSTARTLALFVALLLAPASLAHAQSPGVERVPGRVLVKFRADADARVQGSMLAASGLREKRKAGPTGVTVLEVFDKAKTLAQTLEELEASGLVEYAEPDYLYRATRTIPNDPDFAAQWGLDNTGQIGMPDVDMDAPEAWDITAGAPTQVIAVIDSGTDYGHVDLAGRLWTNPGEIPANGVDDDGNGWVDDVHGISAVANSGDPMDDDGHGTHVTGTIGAASNNGVGVAGVSWNGALMSLKFLDQFGFGSTSDAIECLEYLLYMKTVAGVDVRVANLSWGGTSYSQALLEAIEAVGRAGILVVAAAGNDAQDNDVQPHYPASYASPYIVSVASIDSSELLATTSNWGVNSVDLAAPGVSILSTTPGGSYAYQSGTSMAAPHVSGTAQLIASRWPDASPLTLRGLLLERVKPAADVAGLVATGGRVSAAWTVGCVPGTPALDLMPELGSQLHRGQPVRIEVVVRDCADPIENAAVTLTPSGGGFSVTALDDGVAPDVAAGDGVYTTEWTPLFAGPVTLTAQVGLADGGQVTDSRDFEILDLEYVELTPPAYQWIETGGGTPLALGDDAQVLIPIGFDFRFYGSDYDQVWVDSNGYLSFAAGASMFQNGGLPTPGPPDELIAVYWDDLNGGFASGTIEYLLDGTAPDRRLTVSWLSVSYFGTVVGPTFQVTLFENGGRIEMRYEDVSPGGPSKAWGASATVGLEGAGGSLAIEYGFDEAVLQNQSVISFGLQDDIDSDGVLDGNDNCPLVANVPQADADADGIGDACDNCPWYASSQTVDSNGDGIGDVCQCGDQGGPQGSGAGSQDGRLNLYDILAVQDAILAPTLATPLCDTNNDDACNLFDLFGVQDALLGVPAYCERHPQAPPAGP